MTNTKSPLRNQQISDFLVEAGWPKATRQILKGDASFRQYERIIREGVDGQIEMSILMDAPPEHEDVRPFITVGDFLCGHGFSAPKILAKNVEHGLLLLEDLKVDSFTLVLSGATLLLELRSIEERLYKAAADVLTSLHKVTPPAFLPKYNDELLLREVVLLTEWYMPYRGISLTKEDKHQFAQIWMQIFQKIDPRYSVMVHRDYHADNLMWLAGRPDGIKQVGILDFQDAVIGNPAYDLVSLLEDARRDVLPDTAEFVFEYFLDKNPHLNPEAFRRSYAILGAQRNLKIIGIFSRLAMRDKKTKYLDYLPRVWKHLDNDLMHPVLAPVKAWLDRLVPDRKETKKKPASLRS